MVIHKKTNLKGTERGLPKAFANRPRLVSRVGIFTGFTKDNAFKVCWGGTDSHATVASFIATDWTGTYDGDDFTGRNLLIHWIRCINNNSKDKEIHFWQNNYDATQTVGSEKGDVTHADYMFNVAMAAGEGQHDIKLDFPLPLLVMGGCTIAVRDVKEHDNSSRGMFLDADTDCVVQICYTVLNSTPANAPYKRLKYKYLSAFSFSGGGTSYSGSGINEFSGDQAVIRPDSASTKWFEDIELWGVTVMNRINPAGDADSKIAQARCKNADGEIVCSAAVVKGPSNALELPIVPVTPALLNGYTGWTHGFNWGDKDAWIAWLVPLGGDPFPISVDKTAFKLFGAGSDTQVSMFRFPVYVRGRHSPGVAGGVENFKVSVSGTAAEHTKSTWFYRPARKKAIQHRWV